MLTPDQITLGFLLAVLVADFISGFGHWLEDAYCRANTGGFVGSQVCEPNLRHHQHPADFTKGSFWQRNYTTFALATPLLIVGMAIGSLFVVVVACVVALSNEIHTWSHRRPKHWLPRILQEMGLVQSPQQHAQHHRAPYTTRYCVITNTLNPLLDRLKFWRGVERVVYLCIGVKPNHWGAV